ncbi:MAG: pantoate--beta-alanine ligase [Bacteroidota bacterium]
MRVFEDIKTFRAWRQGLGLQGRIGLVPTMGALHAGHLQLVERAVRENDHCVVTIFVNPTQFGPNEDFERYPRDLAADTAMLKAAGVTAVLAPDHKEVYPAEPQFYFNIRQLDKRLCGASRPGHMNGVVQVVSILFNLVQPSHAYFGEKDYQQLRIIQTMAQELHFPVEVVPCPIVREADGLAMSSRNRYLDPTARQQALALSTLLREVKERKVELSTPEAALAYVQKRLADFPLVQLDYFEILSGETLEPIPDVAPARQPHAFMAAYLGKTRLIDNMPL